MTRKPKPSDQGREPLFLLTADEATLENIVALVERMYGEECTPQEIEAARKEFAGEDGGLIPSRAEEARLRRVKRIRPKSA